MFSNCLALHADTVCMQVHMACGGVWDPGPCEVWHQSDELLSATIASIPSVSVLVFMCRTPACYVYRVNLVLCGVYVPFLVVLCGVCVPSSVICYMTIWKAFRGSTTSIDGAISCCYPSEFPGGLLEPNLVGDAPTSLADV